jgi:PPM family protein phosphatase
MHIKFSALSDVGRKYKHNEDYFVIPKSSKNRLLINSKRLYSFILCDGVGGSKSGEIASQLTADWFNKALNSIQSKSSLFPLIFSNILRKGAEGNFRIELTKIIYSINTRIYSLANKHEQYIGMGTTLVSVIFLYNKIFIHSVGDSRCYRYRNNRMIQLTEDQSEVWELYKLGAITKDEIRTHPRRNIITMAIGTSKEIDVNSYEYDYMVGDVFLLCSDGLTDLVSENDINVILKERSSLKNTSKQLIDAANNAGGKDNISVILIEITN